MTHLDVKAGTELAASVDALLAQRAASRLSAQDHTLWGPAAEDEAAKRLSWVGLAESSRPLLAEIESLQAQLREEGLTRVVLAGMGGSSLAPEVICATDGVELTTLDTTDPGQVAAAFADRLESTIVVVSSKSGSTVETDSHRRAAAAAFEAAGIDAAQRIIVVTDPGSPLAELAAAEGYRKVFEADSNVGGRYSALTAFGLVPSGLAGADISALLDDAADIATRLVADAADNPAIVLAAVLGAAQQAGAEKLVFAESGTANRGLADWAEQLIAESTGKDGTGILPVVVEGTDAPGFADAGTDAVPVALGTVSAPESSSGFSIATDGPLGAQFLLWEYATALVSQLLGINPFDQPDVEEAKVQARRLLDEPTTTSEPLLRSDQIDVYADGSWLADSSAGDVPAVLDGLLRTVPAGGYLAVMAYLDRIADTQAAGLRAALARRINKQVTFGWGPRFLHSTGQYHKGGHPNGVFLQITADCTTDLPVPDRPYTFHELQLAQARGDAAVLSERGRPVLRLHLHDRSAGLSQLTELLSSRD